jgi:hypothetical protein
MLQGIRRETNDNVGPQKLGELANVGEEDGAIGPAKCVIDDEGDIAGRTELQTRSRWATRQ